MELFQTKTSASRVTGTSVWESLCLGFSKVLLWSPEGLNAGFICLPRTELTSFFGRVLTFHSMGSKSSKHLGHLGSRYQTKIGSLGSFHAGKYIIHTLSVWETSTCRHFWLTSNASESQQQKTVDMNSQKINNCLVGIPIRYPNLTVPVILLSACGGMPQAPHFICTPKKTIPSRFQDCFFTLKRSEEKSHLAPTQMVEATQILSNKGLLLLMVQKSQTTIYDTLKKSLGFYYINWLAAFLPSTSIFVLFCFSFFFRMWRVGHKVLEWLMILGPWINRICLPCQNRNPKLGYPQFFHKLHHQNLT